MTSGALALSLLLQAAQVAPVLSFPEPGLDDPSAYQGYQTRFYRDSKRNAVQIYLEPRSGRVVLVWADAANESVGFTARDPAGMPVRAAWAAETAQVAGSGPARSIEYQLTFDAPRIDLGWFVLGSMRIERDFQYAERHLLPFAAAPFQVAEESLLVASVGRLPVEERRHHLSLLGAATLEELRGRLQPTVTAHRLGGGWLVRVERRSMDGRNRLALELVTEPGDGLLRPTPRMTTIRSRSGGPVRLRIRVTTDAGALTPLDRGEIFNREFHEFLAAAARAGDSAGRARYRRLERQVRAVELLSTREKLMAGLPNFATYFGRDMMMTALMMRPVWLPTMSEHVIASVLRKLGPGGAVSHEEALGGQAIRENALVYDSLLTAAARAARPGRRGDADSLMAGARALLRHLQDARENYHMIDDEYQLPVLAARYLADTAVPVERKRSFLLAADQPGQSRLAGLLRELALVAGQTRAYAQAPQALNLVSFPKRDSVHWRSASWRDSDAGYAGGRYAMDVNAIWVPQALEAMATILRVLPAIGFELRTFDSLVPGIGETPLAGYVRDTVSLRRAIETWRGARRHFEVRLGPREIEERLRAKLAWLPAEERRYWEKVVAAAGEPRDSLTFLALALDVRGEPIPVVNTDPATGLFLENFTAGVLEGRVKPEWVLREISPFVRAYPVALFVLGLGPLVANDAYASPAIWDRFGKDPYHGPRVVWGREVNLLFLGLANQIAGGFEPGGRLADSRISPYLRAVDEALRRTIAAVQASGLEHNELWSYRIEDGRLLPTRYGTSSDIQLWNATNLAVQFVLSRLPRP
ncbi:MAG TPA: hypothetical protein VHG35_14235 [Gemmatimonadales bacterium]|nr:hypothetical protein [Gemmatimonadales bacterium]